MFFRTSLTCFLLALPVVACTVAQETDAEVAEATEELRSLTASEVVGEIGFGETSAPIAYSKTPLYRALRLRVTKGDLVDVWVRSSNGDARAWLLGPTFQTLKLNADAEPGITDSHLVYHASFTGDAYIAFREENRNDATFTVSSAPKTPVVGADTCPVPASGFTAEIPSGPDRIMHTYPNRRRVGLSVTNEGPVLYTEESWRNGSFGEVKLVKLVREVNGWRTRGFATAQSSAYSIASSLATTHGSDACVAFTDDQGNLVLSCGEARRIIATGVSSGVTMAAHGGKKHVAFGSSDLSYLATDAHADDGSVPEIIDRAWVLDATSLVVDATGTPHIAYVTREPGQREIKYARRGPGGWSVETIEVERARDTVLSSGDNSDSVSLGLGTDGAPIIAYYHATTRSLRLAERPLSAAAFTVNTLDTPRAGSRDSDFAGRHLALQVDCMGRRHIVYSRQSVFDNVSLDGLGIRYAQIEGHALRSEVLPMYTHPGSNRAVFQSGGHHALAFHVGSDGRQTIAMHLGGSTHYVLTR